MMVTRKVRCFRCGFPWTPRTAQPVSCPNCRSRVWNKMKPCCVQSLVHWAGSLTLSDGPVLCSSCGRGWQFECGEWRIAQ